MDSILLVYEIPKHDDKIKSILDYDIEPQFVNTINKPLLKNSFHWYINQSKNKMEIFEKQSVNKETYKIVNAYEDIIPHNKRSYTNKLVETECIKTFSNKFFNTDKIISRAFYKIWEIFMIFPLLKNESKPIITLHLAEAPGSFVQALMYYREKILSHTNFKKDKYIGVSREETTSTYIPSFDDKLNNTNFTRWKYKNSDITSIEIVDKIIDDHKKMKIDLITADGGIDCKDENNQEQELYKLILFEVYCSLKILNNEGSFILKVFDIYTDIMQKVIDILREVFKKVYIYKPLMSRPSNSEKYLVCIEYKKSINIDKLYKMLKLLEKKEFLIDIFPEYIISEDISIINRVILYNLGTIQFKQINDMISYYDNKNYSGDEYNEYYKKRKEANDFWIATFYPLIKKPSDHLAITKILNKLLQKTLEKNDINIKNYYSKLIL